MSFKLNRLNKKLIVLKGKRDGILETVKLLNNKFPYSSIAIDLLELNQDIKVAEYQIESLKRKS